MDDAVHVGAKRPLECLSPDQVDFYRENGYLLVENRLDADTLRRCHEEIARFREEARALSESSDRIDLEDSHTADEPRLRRIKLPHQHSDFFNQLMRSDAILAPARDLLGPDIRLHTSKLNMKSARFGAPVDWHQDFAFYPHTNDDLLAIGVMLDDVDDENGPLMVFPGTHKGPIFDHHSGGVFAGTMDLAASRLDMADAVKIKGPAGSLSIHHVRIVHGSDLNRSEKDRAVLFYELLAADAFPVLGSMTPFGSIEEYDARILCGDPTKEPRLEPVPVRVPQPQPDKRGSIYEIQGSSAAKGFDTYSDGGGM